MNRDYWDSVAGNYGGNILSVFDHDTAGLIRARIATASGASAADLGCGVGRFTPLLAERFDHVEACDLSESCLAQARRRCRELANITFRQLDFVREPAPFAPVDFVLCVNVLLMPSLDERLRAWRLVTNQVRQDGTLLLVVPSLESLLYLDYRMIEWCLHDGLSCAEAVRHSLPFFGSVRDLRQGVGRLEGVRTKHYLREELEVLLPEHGFEVTELVKLEYPWSTLFAEPPAGPPEPLIWDWLAVARRR